MLATDTRGVAIQVFAPLKFDSVSLTGGVAYDFLVSSNSNLKPDMIEFECSEDIQIAINDNQYGLPKKTHIFGVNKGVESIKFTSAVDTTLYLAWH